MKKFHTFCAAYKYEPIVCNATSVLDKICCHQSCLVIELIISGLKFMNCNGATSAFHVHKVSLMCFCVDCIMNASLGGETADAADFFLSAQQTCGKRSIKPISPSAGCCLGGASLFTVSFRDIEYTWFHFEGRCL